MWIHAVEVRNDPGAFTLTYDWRGAATTRLHICTVYRVPNVSPECIDRMLPPGGSDDALPTHDAIRGTPGNGARTLTVAYDGREFDAIPPVGIDDYTLVLSLADESVGPYGATYNTAEGDWTFPVGESGVWQDNFERGDGTVGTQWELGWESDYGGDDAQLFTIDDGAAVGPDFVPDQSYGTMIWATPVMATGQFIEVVLDNWVSDSSFYMRLELANFAGGGTAGTPRRNATFRTEGDPPNVDIYATTILTDDSETDGSYVDMYPWTGSTGPLTFRLDSYADGRQVVTLNGAAVIDFVEPLTALRPGRTPPRVHVALGVKRWAYSAPHPVRPGRRQRGQVCVVGGGDPPQQ